VPFFDEYILLLCLPLLNLIFDEKYVILITEKEFKMAQREVFKDPFGRKDRTVYTDDVGCIICENRYIYADEKTTLPKAGIQTRFREDGTKENSEDRVYDERLGTFRPVKTTYYDTQERKTKTEHFNEKGQISYTNEYIYEGKETKEPSGCIQTSFNEGKKAIKKISVYDRENRTFRTTKKSFYDSMERPFMTTEYDRDGHKSKEKAYTYKEDGSVFVHREQFDKGKLIMKGDFMAVNGCLLPYDMEKKRLITPSEKENQNQFLQQAFRAVARR